MRALQCGTLVLSCFLGSYAFTEQERLQENEVAIVLSRADSIPQEIHTATDPYFEGYIQALVDMHYSEYRVVVIVKDKDVWLANLPANELISRSIMSFVKDIPGVKEVHKLNGVPPEDEELREKYVERPQIRGVWFPQMTELFQPLIADPRNVTYALGYRNGDKTKVAGQKIFGDKAVDISLGDDFAIYRWIDVFHGDLQIGVEAGIWSVFNMDPKPKRESGTELVNTDFYFGIPLTYARDRWSYRLRAYHISSHLGDEFLFNHPEYVATGSKYPTRRVNPSIEAVDFAISYQASEAIRVYAFPGAIVHSDETFKWKPMYIQYGTEARFLGSKFYKQKLYGTLFIALHFRNYQELDWNFDGTYRGGYEFSKLQGIGRKVRFYVEYHHGYSLEGQFSKNRTHYMQYNLNYGF